MHRTWLILSLPSPSVQSTIDMELDDSVVNNSIAFTRWSSSPRCKRKIRNWAMDKWNLCSCSSLKWIVNWFLETTAIGVSSNSSSEIGLFWRFRYTKSNDLANSFVSSFIAEDRFLWSSNNHIKTLRITYPIHQV